MWKPKYFHEMTTKTEYRTMLGSASQSWMSDCMPAASRVWSASPFGWRISDHTTAATTSESTNGAKKRMRSSARPLRRWLRIQAIPSANGSWIASESTTMMALCFRAPVKTSSWKARLKLSRPTKSVGEDRPFHL